MSDIYQYRKVITVAGGVSGISAGAVLQSIVETKTLQTQGKLRSDRKDLRVTYNGVEIDRVLADTGTIQFRCQATISANGNDSGYCLYYGCPTVATSPAQNPANVFTFYSDASTLTPFSVSGTSPVISDMPKPQLLKYHMNPVLPRTPGTGDWKNIRELQTLHYEDGWYYLFYDANDAGTVDGHLGWSIYLAKSQDLVTWTKLGEVLAATPGSTDSATATAANVFKFDGVYYLEYLGSPNIVYEVPAVPYIGHLATATSITGPYTKQGVVMPLGTGFDSHEAIPYTVWFDGTKYCCTYSASSGPSSRGVGYAEKATPGGVWTNRIEILSGEQCENPMLLHDEASGIYYMFANHIQDKTGLFEYTDCDVMYWSTDPKVWDVNNKTTVISPSYGEWDGYIIGLIGNAVVRNGMMYAGYDGRTLPLDAASVYGHEYRSGGMVEAVWPPVWGKRFTVPEGSSVTSSQTFGDGVLRIKARMVGTGNPQLGLGNPSGTRILFQVSPSDTFTVDNNGVAIQAGYLRVKGMTKTYEIRRVGTALTLIFDGVLVSSTSGTSAALPIYVGPDVVVEEISFTPASLGTGTAASEGVGSWGLDAVVSTTTTTTPAGTTTTTTPAPSTTTTTTTPAPSTTTTTTTPAGTTTPAPQLETQIRFTHSPGGPLRYKLSTGCILEIAFGGNGPMRVNTSLGVKVLL